MTPRLSGILAVAATISLTSIPLSAQAPDANTTVDPALFQALEYRSVGPTRGGRSTAVTGYRDRPYTFLMGTVGGGIWRTDNADPAHPENITWTPLTDQQSSLAIGSISFSPLDASGNTVYATTGSFSRYSQRPPVDSSSKVTQWIGAISPLRSARIQEA